MVAIHAAKGGNDQSLMTNKPLQMVLAALTFGFFVGRSGGGNTYVIESRNLASTAQDSGDTLSSADTEYLRREATDAVPSTPQVATTQAASAPVHDGNGWHNIHVYYGDREKLLEPWLDQHKEFSQEGQDKTALSLLKNKRNGFFVDLASNHPIMLSNTFLMEREYNWNGLCIEPNWQYWNGLASLRKCHVVAAVGGGAQSESIKFRFHPFKRFVGAFGGIVGDNFDNKPSKLKDEIEETRYTVALADILEKFNAPPVIDYLSLDVEGAEEYIMKDFPFHKYTFSVLNVERPRKEVSKLLKDNGYRMLGKYTTKFGDTTWIHNSLEVSLS